MKQVVQLPCIHLGVTGSSCMDFLFACRIQRRLEVTILQKQSQMERQAGGDKPVVNGYGCRMGKPLQDVVAGDIGVVVAEDREHYVYITKALPAF